MQSGEFLRLRYCILLQAFLQDLEHVVANLMEIVATNVNPLYARIDQVEELLLVQPGARSAVQHRLSATLVLQEKVNRGCIDG